MDNKLKELKTFIKSFNFCFAAMLLVFCFSIFATFYFSNLWYLVLAVLDVAFYFAFYLVFMLLLNYYTEVDVLNEQNNDIENIKQVLRQLNNIPKEQEIDFNQVNKK